MSTPPSDAEGGPRPLLRADAPARLGLLAVIEAGVTTQS
jgi:hypothetical protein